MLRVDRTDAADLPEMVARFKPLDVVVRIMTQTSNFLRRRRDGFSPWSMPAAPFAPRSRNGGAAALYARQPQGVEWLMGTISNREMLVARWAELVNDPSLRDVPYKVELNAEGTIEMSPADNWHAAVQACLTRLLGNALPDGMVYTECSVLTEAGVRVPDVAWGSADFVQEQGANTPFGRAPEICVEVLSPSNSSREIDVKVKAFLATGAREVWLVRVREGVSFIGPEGAMTRSNFVAEVKLPSSVLQA